MSRRPIVAVVGSGDEIEPAITNARELGALLAELGCVVLSGGRDAGVMKAVNEGAKAVAGSLTIGIIPSKRSHIASSVDVPIITDMNNARNNIIVLSADVVIACGVDGAGTASEVALALKNKKRVILMGADGETIAFFRKLDEKRTFTVETPAQAIQLLRDLVGL